MKDLILSATTLIGDDVVNYNGENLGEVKEIMLDIVNPRVILLNT